MAGAVLARIPVVGGLGCIERVRRLPGVFTAVLQQEPGQPYFPRAVAVLVNGEKVGYLAPEISRSYYAVVEAAAEPLSCPGRRARHSDHESSGVELLLDFSALPAPAP